MLDIPSGIGPSSASDFQQAFTGHPIPGRTAIWEISNCINLLILLDITLVVLRKSITIEAQL
jgi:hypothetical protein